jgi:hypothetical protein
VLERYLADLRFEISNTERLGLRQQLHKDEDVIKGLIAQLSQPATGN